MSESPKRTEIGEIGEFGLIDRLKALSPVTNPSTRVGIGDDAAVIEDGGKLTLVTTDMLLEGVHFDLSYMPLPHLGYKAVSVNVSDIAAMYGLPKYITVNIALSNRFSVEAVEALYQGIHQACQDYNVDLVGGDTTSSHSGLVISITAVGETTPEQLALRSTAKTADILCVTGDLGGAYMGLQVLEREKAVFRENPEMQPDLEKYKEVVGRQLKPVARMDVIFDLRDLGVVPTAMIDISDGLASEVMHLCKSSGLGAVVYEDKLPMTKDVYEVADEFKIGAPTAALNGGEDYELLFTIGQEDYEKIKNHPDITTIGYMQEKENGKVLITRGQQKVPLQAQGWKHFD
ncbi:thiamine-phosphate kinase [Roseivirga sp. BDSF3-8]|uniref:thiamine-phosphate kinase n=1 Tax=Roseivirga sp. BDSF3-8 TaxID=3241598 RepID=UPI0035319231